MCQYQIFLDQPVSDSGDVSQGVEPSRPVEEKTGNQPVESNVHVEGAVELYHPESQVPGTTSDTLHQSLHLNQPGTYAQQGRQKHFQLVRQGIWKARNFYVFNYL
jgi:hypothetical protein